MSGLQQFLTEYLQSELYHSMGAYRVAGERLQRLLETSPNERPDLLHLVDWERGYNKALGAGRHNSGPLRRRLPDDSDRPDRVGAPTRDPIPEHLPLSRPGRFRVEPDNDAVREGRVQPWAADSNWQRIPRFYTQAIDALVKYEPGNGTDAPGDDGAAWRSRVFAQSLVAPRDGTSPPAGAEPDPRRRDHRLDRYRHRLREAHEVLAGKAEHEGFGDRVRDALRRGPGRGHTSRSESVIDRYPPTEAQLDRITRAHLESDDGLEPLAVFVVKAQAEAHLCMHAVEAWQSMSLGEHAAEVGREQRAWLLRELDRSIALSTFAYCVSRTAPWVFAADEDEARGVFTRFAAAWENIVPARCVWIANQISLLALHRRAYARSLRDESDRAYNDYHKLQRLIRDTERRVRAAPIHVEGALDFLAGLDAQAHHHIGELYRSEHAHRPALDHFEAASYRLERLRGSGRMDAVLANSRWNVQLQVSRGKAAYELGRHKEALCWHLFGWRAFLDLLANDTKTVTNTAAISEAISWLEQVRFEPELRKSEVSSHMGPVIAQLERVTVSRRLGALAAEILLRLGHLLFVLNVDAERPETSVDATGKAAEDAARRRVDGTLAFRCLTKAAECDRFSTLVGADLLKARFRFNETLAGPLPAPYLEALRIPASAPIAEHWPRGGNDYEQVARVAEYLMLRMRISRYESERAPADEGASDADVARDLLLNLFMSTDSINVRKSQIHRFLMKRAADSFLPGDDVGPAIEFVCMRRYSSPFPLLPRPSAFRALGGGYFVRLHHKAGADSAATVDQAQTYGVVVDPGVDFVENLYRTGYCLDDVHMIVLTHDHVDHLGAFDPLLSLLHVRSELLSKQSQSGLETARRVKVLVSRSVDDRYANVAGLREREPAEFEFRCFEDMAGENGLLDSSDEFWSGFPPDFEVLVMSSSAGNAEIGGHLDLSRQPSHGVCFRQSEAGPSLAFTSDTPPPPPRQSGEYRQWREAWMPALTADALVVHLGSVPLTELRRIDSLSPEPRVADGADLSVDEDHTALRRIREQLQAADGRLEGQIEYAQWLRSHVPHDQHPLTADLIGDVQPEWLPPLDHNYLSGLLRWAREYRQARTEDRQARTEAVGRRAPTEPREIGGLFVVGELSEELGTMRSKIASRLNEHVFEVPRRRTDREGHPRAHTRMHALTADIGLHACVTAGTEHDLDEPPVKVLCTTCSLDTDRVPNERFHSAHDVFEVCVKGENEGIFYNCREHDPSGQDDPSFLEQLERFDIFGR